MLYLLRDATSAVSGLQAAKSYHCQWYDPEQNIVTAAVQKKVSNTTEKLYPRHESIVLYLKLFGAGDRGCPSRQRRLFYR